MGLGATARNLRQHVGIIAGFALFCALLRQPYFGTVIAAELPDAHTVRTVLDGSIMALAIIAIVIGIHKKTAIPPRYLPFACIVSFAIGVGALATTSLAGLGEGWLAFAGVVFCAFGFTLLAVLWTQVFSHIAREDLVPVAMASFTISLLLGFADIATGAAKAVINVAIPTVSALIAARIGKKAQGTQNRERTEGSLHIVVLIAVALSVEVLCCSLIRGTWAHGGVGYAGLNSHQVISYCVSAAIGIALFLIAALTEQPEKSGVAISAASLAGLIILIVILALSGRGIASSFVTSLYSALLVVLFAILASAARDGLLPQSVSAGVFCLVFTAVSLVSYTVIPSLFAYDASRSSEFLLPTALAAALLIAIGVCAVMIIQLRAQVKTMKGVLGEASREQLWNGIALHPGVVKSPAYASEEDALAASVEKATELYRLTAREADIVKLFAQGRTIKRTAEELCLAPSTVQGYTKSIYAKLGVHGKDEIKDLLNDLTD